MGKLHSFLPKIRNCLIFMQVPELGGDSKTRKYREEKRHTNSKVGEPDKLSYLQVLVGFEGPDGGVSELDVVQSLIRGVFVDFSTGEPIPMLLSQRCHFYNWELLLATFCLKRHRGDDHLWAELTHTYRSTHARTHAYFRFREVPVVGHPGLFLSALWSVRGLGFGRS